MSSLVLIDKFVGGFGNDAIVTGIDNTYSRYKVIFKSGYTGNNNGVVFQVTKSGTPQTGSNYRHAGTNQYQSGQRLRNGVNTTDARIYNNTEEANARSAGMVIIEIDLYNFANSSGYDYAVARGMATSNDIYSYNAPVFAFVHTVASASDGFCVRRNSNNSISGELALYGVM